MSASLGLYTVSGTPQNWGVLSICDDNNHHRERLCLQPSRPLLLQGVRTVITDKKLTMHSLRHRMKDKLRNTGCPEAISLAILGHSSNTVAANYGLGYALEVMREHMVRVWEE